MRQAQHSYSEIEQIGIGLPGTLVKATCTLTFGTNLGMSNVCFAHAFEPEFNCPVNIDNDANCAALGEFHAAQAAAPATCSMVTLGTGVGGGIVLEGKLYTGREDIAGEIGHMVIVRTVHPATAAVTAAWRPTRLQPV